MLAAGTVAESQLGCGAGNNAKSGGRDSGAAAPKSSRRYDGGHMFTPPIGS